MANEKSLRILLVEDAKVMRTMEKKVLSSLGHKDVVEAEDGLQAIEYLENNQVDIIISDWNMPNKDGYELLLWVRGDDKNKETPFLMATGRGERKEIAKAEKAGVSSFIAKPFNAAELKVKIDEAFGVVQVDDIADKRHMNKGKDGKVELKIGHIQITDHLVVGVLKHLIDKGEYSPKHFTLNTECMPSWNPIANALEKHTVDAACILAPLAMDLRGGDVPLKLVSLAHKNGSIMVRNKSGDFSQPFKDFFKDKSFLLPHFMSVHHMLAHLFFTGIGLKPGMPGAEQENDLSFEIVPPVKMPEILGANHDTAGYLVAEPLGTKAIANGIAEQQFLSSQLWEDHPCCVVVFREEFINEHEEAVYEFVDLLVKAGKFIEQKPETAAEIGVEFLDPEKKLGLKVPILKNVLTDPLGITTDDLFPIAEELNIMQKYMHDDMGIGTLIDVNTFVDDRFARKACKNIAVFNKQSFSIEQAKKKAVKLLHSGQESTDSVENKSLLNAEGKYLTFCLDNQEFGIDIMGVKEIIKIRPINSIPHSPKFIKGLITLREVVVPIMDVKYLLGSGIGEYNEKSVIVILEIEQRGKSVVAGIIVDSVNTVTDINAKLLEEPPKFGGKFDTNYILAMVKAEENIKILIDIEKLVGNHDILSVGESISA